MLRIGTMDCCAEEDILQDLRDLERTLGDLGCAVERGSGVAAASGQHGTILTIRPFA